MQLDVESLRTLLAVLDDGGMTKAAERLNMGQSAVSRKIQRLEDRVGRPLLIRDGHTLRPTRDARMLLADARSIVELHDRAVARLESSDLSGTVKLCSNGEIDAGQIASLLGLFKQRHPGANVEFTIESTGQLVDWVQTGKVDLAVFEVAEQAVRPGDIPLWTEDLTWVIAETGPYHEDPVPLVDFGPHCYYNDFVHDSLRSAGVDFRTVFSAASSLDVRAAVQAGIGIAAMSTRYVGGDITEWRPTAELKALPRVTQIIRSVPGERPDAVAALIETIQRELTQGRLPT